MRLAMELEALYASQYPFLNYGADLDVMAELEKGIKVERLTDNGTRESDMKIVKEKKQETHDYLARLKSRRTDKVPIKFEGRAEKGYLCYDLIDHRGRGSPNVTNTFKQLVRHVGAPTEHMVNKEQVRRMKLGGPRYATMGRSGRCKWMHKG